MKLYGTTTSPFVRRVRIVAHELGVPVELVPTATEAGQAALRAVTPIGKVPVAELDGRVVFDSHVIIDRLIAAHGPGLLALPPRRDALTEANLGSAIDAALEAAIALFYLRRDGVAIDGTLYAERQLARVAAIVAWLEAALVADGRGFGEGLGLSEIALVTTLDWMAFRQTYPVARFGKLQGVRDAWADRPAFASSPPRV